MRQGRPADRVAGSFLLPPRPAAPDALSGSGGAVILVCWSPCLYENPIAILRQVTAFDVNCSSTKPALYHQVGAAFFFWRQATASACSISHGSSSGTSSVCFPSYFSSWPAAYFYSLPITVGRADFPGTWPIVTTSATLPAIWITLSSMLAFGGRPRVVFLQRAWLVSETFSQSQPAHAARVCFSCDSFTVLPGGETAS